MNKLFFEILDSKRLAVLPLLRNLKKDFYLAGGTALALQLGHRDSIDFDFFSRHSFSTVGLFEKFLAMLDKYQVKKIQDAKDTLTILIDGRIKVSCFAYDYRLIDKLVDTGDLRLASVADIGCMKLSAIVGRATIKDYVDLYFILQKIKLSRLIKLAERKFPAIETNLILKSLVYFDDLEEEPIRFKGGNSVQFTKVRAFLCKEVERFLSLP